jgi:hypothetical protein
MGQTFVAQSTGTVNTISFSVHTANTAPTATVYLCDATVSELSTTCIAGNPGVGKTNKVVTLPVSPTIATPVTVQFDTGFPVTSGTTYVLHIRATAGNLGLNVDTTDNHYSGGYRYNTDTSIPAQDLDFSVDGYRAGGRDYVASNGSIIFDASESIDTTGNTAAVVDDNIATTSSDDYVYNVSAIAKDNTQLLINTKSHSAGEAIPFLRTEIENSALLDDKEFMFVGSTNGTASTFVSADMPAGLPTATNSRTRREWRVQKNAVVSNTVVVDPAMGTFKLTFDLDAMNISAINANGFRLVVDDNGNFTSGTQTVYPTSGEPTYDATTNSVSFTGVSLVDGQYFTLTLPRQAPGGVTTGLRAWFKAGAGAYSDLTGTAASVDNGNTNLWKDLSGNAIHLTQGSSLPDYRASTNTLASMFNYNPAIDFEQSADDRLLTAATGLFPTGALLPNWETYTIASSENFTSINSHEGIWGGQGTNLIQAFSSTDLYHDAGSVAPRVLNSIISSVVNQAYLYTTQDYSTGSYIAANVQQNGKIVNALGAGTYAGFTPTAVAFNVGSYQNGVQNFDGPIGEMVFYTSQHTAAEINRINSYLATKYGVTLRGGEMQITEADVATSTAIGQVFTAKSTAAITAVNFKSRTVTPNSTAQFFYICTGDIATIAPNSTRVADCVGNPTVGTTVNGTTLAYKQAVTVSTALNTVIPITLTTPLAITAGTQYALVLGDTVANAKTVALK